MLTRMKELDGYRILATDGDIGHAEDFLLDDEKFGIRFIVVNTGFWLFGRKVLISPHAVSRLDKVAGEIVVNLSQQQVKDSPDIDTEMPVSREHEMQLLRYYNWPVYWGGMGLWRESDKPQLYPIERHSDEAVEKDSPPPFLLSPEGSELNPHLRSIKELRGYHIDARGSVFGHIEDAFVDNESWALRYLLVDTKSWWPSLPVPISTEWITDISWEKSLIRVDLDPEQIKSAPALSPHVPFDRTFEARLYSHYGKTGYWDRLAA
ncbi:MAG: hypothetical protein A2X94_12300 [Bdellovibrionales bacterium GWB1_55_8]|nr:MAG: hypothetical protein A2X94_12300 [Bdellovibrionales bacterium GWB1_55_8]